MRQARGSRGSQRGATAIEYGILIGLVGVAVIASVSLLGGNLSDSFCNTADSIGEQNCAQGASASDSAAGTGSDSTAGATGGTENPGGGAVSAEPDSSGTVAFTTAVIEQDQRKRDLSVRFNLGWTADDPDYTGHPESVTVDVTWSPALEVDQVITGETGKWEYTLVEPGHMRLTRTGTLDEGGFNPEPEILLTKSYRYETVEVTFTAEAPDTPPVSESDATISNPWG